MIRAKIRLFSTVKLTPLSLYNKETLKARMVPFAGYSMPVEYKEATGGGLLEHSHVRNQAGLFDVSHMGVLKITGNNRLAFLNRLVVADLYSLRPGQAVYSLIMNEKGGIVDDTIITAYSDHVSMVVNAGCKDKDIKHLKDYLTTDVHIEYLEDYGLLALQGPKAAQVLQRLLEDDLNKLKFMNGVYTSIKKINSEVLVTRCGYTGEDGFEITIRPDKAIQLAELILQHPEVKPIGLGARDSLRLEAGLCLYGKAY
jgi:aminomethyltransferase